jgi:hypothetical protein
MSEERTMTITAQDGLTLRNEPERQLCFVDSKSPGVRYVLGEHQRGQFVNFLKGLRGDIPLDAWE